MNIIAATRHFESWLARQTALIKPDLRLKHSLMAEAAFPFLRATFYRWMQLWPEVCPELAKAPRVLAVGDLHVENFGTWRDIDGRLVWGVNDFDEAAPLPYTVDLVRLATSALLAIDEGHLEVKSGDACAAILEGYQKCLNEGGRPFVLEENNTWLRQIALNELRDPVRFWAKMDSLPTVRAKLSPGVISLMKKLLPEHKLEFRTVRRVAGLGSLGHVRVVAVAGCRGSRVAREAKALAPSSAYWANQHEEPFKIFGAAILARAVRDPDPFYQVHERWIIRRLSPDCSRVELKVLPVDRDEGRLLSAMGWETANVHLGSKNAVTRVQTHLQSLKSKWLSRAAKDMAKAVLHDWRVWKTL